MSDPQDPFAPLPEVQPPPMPQPSYTRPQPMPFAPQMLGVPQVDGSAIRGQAIRMMVIGAIFAVVGIVITTWTYSSASHSSTGGTYFVAYGPIIFGTIRFFQGLIKLGSAPS